MSDCCALWVALWTVGFLTYGLWKLTERLSRPKPPPPPPPPPPDESAERKRREEEQKRLAEEAEKAAAEAEARRYYEENAGLVGDIFPRAAFNAWLRLYMAADLGSKQRWDALRELISRLQPVVAQQGQRRRGVKKRRRRRENLLRDIDAQIAQLEQQLAAFPAKNLPPEVAAAEESRLLRRLRRLREQRRKLGPTQPRS